MRFLIGIDDTDNKQSRGTGFRARQLGALLADVGLTVDGITRHQLLVDSRIPYTSHNSSACLSVQGEKELTELAKICGDFLVNQSADGSDAGLCISLATNIKQEIIKFGSSAKVHILTQGLAVGLAKKEEILLEGLTGDGGGIIGALAAIGLRAGGDDGRFIWLKGLREINGIHTSEQLLNTKRIDKITTIDGFEVPYSSRIDIGSWPRPILKQGLAVFLVEKVKGNKKYDWRMVSKEIIKRF